jgi:hypothetical protein
VSAKLGKVLVVFGAVLGALWTAFAFFSTTPPEVVETTLGKWQADPRVANLPSLFWAVVYSRKFLITAVLIPAFVAGWFARGWRDDRAAPSLGGGWDGDAIEEQLRERAAAVGALTVAGGPAPAPGVEFVERHDDVERVEHVSQHDLDLLKLVRGLVPPATIAYLRGQDFNNSFSIKKLAFAREVAGWNSAQYEFTDDDLQRKWLIAQEAISKFDCDLANNTWPSQHAESLYTIHPTMGDPDHPAKEITAKGDLLNDDADSVAQAIDEFERFARKRLGL